MKALFASILMWCCAFWRLLGRLQGEDLPELPPPLAAGPRGCSPIVTDARRPGFLYSADTLFLHQEGLDGCSGAAHMQACVVAPTPTDFRAPLSRPPNGECARPRAAVDTTFVTTHCDDAPRSAGAFVRPSGQQSRKRPLFPDDGEDDALSAAGSAVSWPEWNDDVVVDSRGCETGDSAAGLPPFGSSPHDTSVERPRSSVSPDARSRSGGESATAFVDASSATPSDCSCTATPETPRRATAEPAQAFLLHLKLHFHDPRGSKLIELLEPVASRRRRFPADSDEYVVHELMAQHHSEAKLALRMLANSVLPQKLRQRRHVLREVLRIPASTSTGQNMWTSAAALGILKAMCAHDPNAVRIGTSEDLRRKQACGGTQ